VEIDVIHAVQEILWPHRFFIQWEAVAKILPSHLWSGNGAVDVLPCYCHTVGMEWESLVLPSSLVGMGTHVNDNSNFVFVSQLSDMIHKITK